MHVKDLAIPVVRQPNGYTCGPACMSMAVRAIRPADHRTPTVTDIEHLSGANPRAGTTEIEMGRGLSKLGLSFRRGDANSLDGLRAEIALGRIVILRTLVSACKHWVVISKANSDGSFQINCPTLGRIEWSGQHLLQAWRARDFDHFLVPHGQTDQSEVSKGALYMRTLPSFLGAASEVVPDDLYSSFELQAIEATARYTQAASVDPVYEIPTEHPWLRFFRAPPLRTAQELKANGGKHCGIAALVVADRASPSAPIAGLFRGTPYVQPQFRRRGVGKAMVHAALYDCPHRYLYPTSFSQAGLAVRVAIHREAIELAQIEGLPIPPGVLESNPSLNPECQVSLPIRSSCLGRAVAPSIGKAGGASQQQEQRVLPLDNGP